MKKVTMLAILTITCLSCSEIIDFTSDKGHMTLDVKPEQPKVDEVKK